VLFNQKPYNLQITYAHALKILSSKSFPELLISEYLPVKSIQLIASPETVKPF
jgi:hypothetical protein